MHTQDTHLRFALLVTPGLLTPVLTWKPPGELSPSLGIMHSDIPNAFGAISEVADASWRPDLCI